MQFDTVIQALADAAAEFVLIGGVSAQLQGSAMLTYDVDVCYSRNAVNLQRLAAALSRFHPRPGGFHMRTTIELPDALLMQAKSKAALRGISLREFFVEAITKSLLPEKPKVRRPPPSIGDGKGPKIRAATREEIDEAMFG